MYPMLEDMFDKNPKKSFPWLIAGALIFGLLYALTPNRKDMALIVAGGAVGEFMVNDPNAKQIPAEVSKFLVEEIKKATTDLHNSDQAEKLKNYTKEELIDFIQKDSK